MLSVVSGFSEGVNWMFSYIIGSSEGIGCMLRDGGNCMFSDIPGTSKGLVMSPVLVQT